MTNYAEQDQQRSAARAAFVAAVPAIVTALRALEPIKGWALKPATDPTERVRWVKLYNADDEDLFLGFDEYKTRIDISANWPTLPDGTTWYPRKYRDEASPAIGVSATKAPAQIARDIVRRFLPAYRALLAIASADVASATAYRDTTADTFDRLIAGCPHLRADRDSTMANRGERRRGGDLTASIVNLEGVSCYGGVRVSGDSVTLERLNVNGECARRVLAALVACVEGGR